MTILAGFTVPEGERFEIPTEGHLAWFGQTQLSGKTTALEAFVFRGRLKAIAFITKRGEGSFLTGHMIPPYFSEPTNDPEQPMWRWVKSILEASQQRRMNFEESWIIRACEGGIDDPKPAKSLADVHANIKVLLAGKSVTVDRGRGKKKRPETKWLRKPVTGMNAGIYTSLKAYFDIVMPQLARLPYTKRLVLNPGLNVMDLREYAMETQALVIRSVMEWVYQHERGVRVIVPEAQDFVPQGKNTPVKMACETLVRKGGADKNFMWLDSQDMAAVDKVMLRACSIVGCGVQTEMHEIDRTLAGMFSPTLRPVDVARLKTGQFFVRLPEARVAKVYVMPAWMDSEPHAQAIARGEVSLDSAKAMRAEFAAKAVAPKRVADSNASQPAEVRAKSGDEPVDAATSRADRREDMLHQRPSDGREATSPLPTQDWQFSADEETMWKEKYEELAAQHKESTNLIERLTDEVKTLRKALEAADVKAALAKPEPASLPGANGTSLNTASRMAGEHHFAPDFIQALYGEIKTLAARDPGILEILANQPELRIRVKRQTIEADGGTLRGSLAILISEKFFDGERKFDELRKELIRRGFVSSKAPNRQISQAVTGLLELGFLTAEPDGYRAVAGMKVHILEERA